MSATTVTVSNCIALRNPTNEVIDKLASVKLKESRDWVVDFNKLYEAWGNKRICGTINYIESIIRK